MPVLASLPLIGTALASVAGAVRADPRSVARTALQTGFVVYMVLWAVMGLNGRRIAAAMESGKDRTFDAAAFEFGDNQSANRPAKAGEDGKSKGPGKDLGSNKGKGYDDIKAGLKRTRLPEEWADSAGLWNIVAEESTSSMKGLNYKATNPTSGALGPFQLNPVSGTLQQYAGRPPYSKESLVDGGLKYIKDRYQNPDKAWAFWQVNGWY